ncbi:MAG: hypothetical protein H0T62_11135 [Parachlamydiaceae bacterium]|nr:hypothetical protein [Parachlamydiaceae bacterium]
MIERHTKFTPDIYISDLQFTPEISEECQIATIAICAIPLIIITGWGVYRMIVWNRKYQSPTSIKVNNTSHESLRNNDIKIDILKQQEMSMRKEPYSYDEVISLAETAFKEHTNRIRILEGIENKLERRNYQACVNEGITPFLYGEEDVYIKYPNHKADYDSSIRKDILIHKTVFEFFDLLPGVDVTPYRSVDIKEGMPLTSQEVMERANKEFSEHKDKVEILKKIENKLKTCGYDLSLGKGIPPYLNKDGYFSSYSGARMPDEIEVNAAVSRFLRSLPGVDVAPYIGQRLK